MKDATLDLQRFAIEAARLNSGALWIDLLHRLHAAQGGRLPLDTSRIAAPETTLERFLAGFADEHAAPSGREPRRIFSDAVMFMQSANAELYATLATLSLLNAALGREVLDLAGPQLSRVGAMYLGSVQAGGQCQHKPTTGAELIANVTRNFSPPANARAGATGAWGLMHAENAFGRCPGKGLSRVIFSVYGRSVAADPASFLARLGAGGAG